MKGKNRILIGLSGGVDSAAAAIALLREGHEVEGLFIRSGFPGPAEDRAAGIAAHLGIRLHRVDAAEDFRMKVVDPFVASYLAGKTPNPCVICNREIKFSHLLRVAEERGFIHVASGHYARSGYDAEQKRCTLLRGADRNKDQSYFLFLLDLSDLGRIIFPNGTKTKGEVKKAAVEAGLAEAVNARESQDVCFIPRDDYKAFLQRHVAPSRLKPGLIVDTEGRTLGTHGGIHEFTVGQRRGLGISSPVLITSSR